MRTLDVRQQHVTVAELLRVARTESVRIVDEAGAEEESTTATIIDQLLQHPLKVTGFKPLAREEIYERL